MAISSHPGPAIGSHSLGSCHRCGGCSSGSRRCRPRRSVCCTRSVRMRCGRAVSPPCSGNHRVALGKDVPEKAKPLGQKRVGPRVHHGRTHRQAPLRCLPPQRGRRLQELLLDQVIVHKRSQQRFKALIGCLATAHGGENVREIDGRRTIGRRVHSRRVQTRDTAGQNRRGGSLQGARGHKGHRDRRQATASFGYHPASDGRMRSDQGCTRRRMPGQSRRATSAPAPPSARRPLTGPTSRHANRVPAPTRSPQTARARGGERVAAERVTAGRVAAGRVPMGTTLTG